MKATALLLAGCTLAPLQAARASADAAATARATLAAKVAELRAANYAIDEAAATRLAGEFRALGDDPAFPLRALAWYEAGTAHAFLAGFVSPGSVAHPQGDRARFLAASAAAAERELHAWGEPDAWAFLAFVSLALDPPDVGEARRAVDRALALRADFAWARRALLPRVETAEAKSAEAAAKGGTKR
jgi:hypothetical protein